MKKISWTAFLVLAICLLGIGASAADPVYVDGTGKTEGAYATLEEAIAALPDEGGSVIVSGDTTVGETGVWVTMPEKSGKVTLSGANGAKLIIAHGLVLGSDTEFDAITFVNSSTREGFITADGHALTIGENVTTERNGTERWLTIWAANNTHNNVTDYDTHVTVKAGTWRYIFGGSKGICNGDSFVTVSNTVITNTISAKNEGGKGEFNGVGTLTVDLRGDKTVSAGTFAETPVFITDEGCEAILDGNTYYQIRVTPATVYADGTEKTEGAYATLDAAIQALPAGSGMVVVCGNTETGSDLSVIRGEITVRGENNAVLTLSRDLSFECDGTLDGVGLAAVNGSGIRVAKGAMLTVTETVFLASESFLVELEKDSSAYIGISGISIRGADGCSVDVNGNVYTATVRGDIDGDKRIGIADVLRLFRSILNGSESESMDVNGDGAVNLVDGLCILKLIMQGSIESEPESKLYTIDELNEDGDAWSHKNDDISKASLEINYRDIVVLNRENIGNLFFDAPWYPRMKKVQDDLYLLTYMNGTYGGGMLYYTTSPDGKTWTTPKTLWRNSDRPDGGKITHTEGPLAGKSDSILAVNPDFCVLDNGEILAVYYVRAGSGFAQGEYEPYQKYSGVFMKRGVVGADNRITWGNEQQLSIGNGWEPFVWQRSDGRIEIYWTNAATSLLHYGDDSRSFTSMIYSDDGGYTWTPKMEDGPKTDYMYLNVYQEVVGEDIPPKTDANGNPLFTEPIPYFKGQMISATPLYNGKTLIAAEVKGPDTPYHVSLATSGENGEWTPLAFGQDATKITEAIAGDKAPLGAAPYLTSFPSGEVYLVYNEGNDQRGRLVSPDGKTVDTYEYHPTGGNSGCWGACSALESHKAVSVYPSCDGTIYIYTSYLNHRINAKNKAITVDGYTNDWNANTDALFVGSASQAQVTLRVAHDTENVYFLFSLLDEYLTDGDAVIVGIGEDSAKCKYGITVQMNGQATLDTYLANEKTGTVALSNVRVVLHGTIGSNDDKDAGAVVEIAVPKADLELAGKNAFSVLLALTNNDGGESISDTFEGVSITSTDRWPKVVLD